MRERDEEQERIMQLDYELIDLWHQKFEQLYSTVDIECVCLCSKVQGIK